MGGDEGGLAARGRRTFHSLVVMERCCLCSDVGLVLWTRVPQLSSVSVLCPEEPFVAVQSHQPFVNVCDGHVVNNSG